MERDRRSCNRAKPRCTRRPARQEIPSIILANKGPFRDANGQVVGLLGICRDITDRKRAEEEMRRSQQKLSIHFEHTPLAVVEWDLQFRVAAWNPSAERIFGYSRQKPSGSTPALLFLLSSARRSSKSGGITQTDGRNSKRE